MLKLTNLATDYVIDALSDRVRNTYGRDLLTKAIEHHKALDLRFSVKTGITRNNNGVLSVVRNYKSNPYDRNDIDSMIYDQFGCWIANSAQRYNRMGEF